jgi:hypothetical protein
LAISSIEEIMSSGSLAEMVLVIFFSLAAHSFVYIVYVVNVTKFPWRGQPDLILINAGWEGILEKEKDRAIFSGRTLSVI